jgi:hypothetical protein
LTDFERSGDKLDCLSRNRIAVFGLLAISVLTVFNLLLDVPHSEFGDIGQFDRGVALLRPTLPQTGVVGFYTDAPAGPTGLQEYYLTQYALAPLVVVNNTDQKLVVSSTRSPGSRPPNPNLELIRDFKNGMQLFRNKTK